MTTLEVLTAARAKIAQGWTQGACARDVDGDEVLQSSERATCWCASGAVYATCSGDRFAASDAFDSLERLVPTRLGIAGYNDAPERTHADVLALMDRAIAAEAAQ